MDLYHLPTVSDSLPHKCDLWAMPDGVHHPVDGYFLQHSRSGHRYQSDYHDRYAAYVPPVCDDLRARTTEYANQKDAIFRASDGGWRELFTQVNYLVLHKIDIAFVPLARYSQMFGGQFAFNTQQNAFKFQKATTLTIKNPTPGSRNLQPATVKLCKNDSVKSKSNNVCKFQKSWNLQIYRQPIWYRRGEQIGTATAFISWRKLRARLCWRLFIIQSQ